MLQTLEERIKEIITEKGGVPSEDELFQQLVIWKEYLKKDYDSQEDEIRYKVREAWMMMNTLNLAKEIKGKKLKGSSQKLLKIMKLEVKLKVFLGKNQL